jgi:hypothetical protein
MYKVWQKINEIDFLLTMNFILFTKVIPFLEVQGMYSSVESVDGI